MSVFTQIKDRLRAFGNTAKNDFYAVNQKRIDTGRTISNATGLNREFFSPDVTKRTFEVNPIGRAISSSIGGLARGTADVISSKLYQPQIEAQNKRQRELDAKLLAQAKKSGKPLPKIYGTGQQSFEKDILGRNITTNADVLKSSANLATLATFGAPQATIPLSIRTAAPVTRLLGSSAIRGVENAALNLPSNISANKGLSGISKQFSKDIILGAGANILLSPKLVAQGGKQMLNSKGSIPEKGAVYLNLFAGEKAAGGLPKSGTFTNLADKKTRFEISDKGANLKQQFVPQPKTIGATSSLPKELVSEQLNLLKKDSAGIITPAERLRMDEIATTIKNMSSQGKKNATVGDILDHPELYKKYPWAKDIQIDGTMLSPGTGGSFNPKTNTISLSAGSKIDKSTLLHEIQHAIQQKEGFASGGSPNMFKGQNQVRELIKQQQKDFAGGFWNWSNEIMFNNRELFKNLLKKGEKNADMIPFYEEYAKLLPEEDRKFFVFKMKDFDQQLKSEKSYRDPINAYKHLAGEVESRDVQARMNLTPEQRLRQQPYQSQGIMPKDQIVRFGGGNSASIDENAFYNAGKLEERDMIESIIGSKQMESIRRVGRSRAYQNGEIDSANFPIKDIDVMADSYNRQYGRELSVDDFIDKVLNLPNKSELRVPSKIRLQAKPEPTGAKIYDFDTLKPVSNKVDDATPNSGINADFLADENPQSFKKTLNKWIGLREAAKTKGTLTATKYAKIDKNIGREVIDVLENPARTLDVSPQSLNIATELRNEFDNLYNQAKQSGIDMNYVKNYVTHIWEKSPEEVARAYKSATQKFGFSKERAFPTYQEGIKMGLKPKYTSPAQIIESYVTKLEETKANITLFNDLKSQGLIVKNGQSTPGMRAINAPGFPQASEVIGDGTTRVGSWYAPDKVARDIEKIFSPEVADSFGSKVLEKAGKASGYVQDITMSGGIPKTAVNAFSIAQMTKEFLSGRVKSPFATIFRTMSQGKSNEFFANNAQQIIKMQERGISVGSSFEVKNLVDEGTIKNLFGRGIGEAWSKTMNDPTFKRFMPMLEINYFNDIENAALRAGKNAEEASDIAAQAVKNFYGKTDTASQALRPKWSEDLKKAALFAPKYRESMISFWWNNLKALKDPLALENRGNTTFMVGATITFLAMNQANKEFNGGKNMWENPKGKEDKLLIPMGDGYTIGIPFLSSIATVPRTVGKIALNVAKGDYKQAGLESKSFLSSAAKVPFDIMQNENYFGSPIYKDSDTPTEKQKKIGMYAFSQINHPYIKQFTDPSIKDRPTYQRVSMATEMPIRYYDTEKMKASELYAQKDTLQAQTTKRNNEFKNAYIAGDMNKANKIAEEGNMTKQQITSLKNSAKESVLEKSFTPVQKALYSMNKTQRQAMLQSNPELKNEIEYINGFASDGSSKSMMKAKFPKAKTTRKGKKIAFAKVKTKKAKTVAIKMPKLTAPNVGTLTNKKYKASKIV